MISVLSVPAGRVGMLQTDLFRSWTFTSMRTDVPATRTSKSMSGYCCRSPGAPSLMSALAGAGAPGARGRARLHDVQAGAGQRERAAAHVALGAGGAAPRLTRRPIPCHPGPRGVSCHAACPSSVAGQPASSFLYWTSPWHGSSMRPFPQPSLRKPHRMFTCEAA